MSKKRIAIGALGGTISMTASQSGGVTSTLGARELAETLPGIADLADLSLHTLQKLPSGSIRFEHLFDCLAWAQKEVNMGAAGVIITQGTDTLEESAFFLDLFWKHEAPLVLMGAMRSPAEPGADGAANLSASVAVACSQASANRGVLVVMNDEIHEARHVRKTHSTRLNAFESPVFGVVGVVSENRVQYFRPTVRKPQLAVPASTHGNVLLLEHALGDDPGMLSLLLEHGACQGVVVAGFGAGHVSESMRDVLVAAAQRLPVIVCSRTGAGTTTQAVYGYKGAEIDLQKNGILMGQWLCPRKARLLLSVALWNDCDREQIKELLGQWGASQ
ncbi:asparaginase [Advenella sp. RU8]|uniref:asparaginase n=1 Tax=Advenella sp. RU8 TaxID=3399575 RepID=UPI003AB01E31